MEFLLHYLWPSIKVTFGCTLKWVAIIVVLIVEYLAILALSWGILLFPLFIAIDIAIIRAYGNYEDDKEGMKAGYPPKYRDK